ncbi:MAG: hypothetical protein WD926_00130 [Patescibacteria group bacterium]
MPEESSDTVLTEAETDYVAETADDDEAVLAEALGTADDAEPVAEELERRASRNGSGELSEGVVVTFPGLKEAPKADAEPPSSDGIDRLALTTANHFGIDVERISNPRTNAPEVATARIIVFSVLENEFGMSREDIASHFGRTKNSVSMVYKNPKNRQRLLNSRVTVDTILGAFRAGDTLVERAERIRAEKDERRLEAEAARAEKRRPSSGQEVREVPKKERQLFEDFRDEKSEGHEKAVQEIEDTYLGPVRQAMRKRLKGSGIRLSRTKAQEVLHRTANWFGPVASERESFESWVKLVAGREAEKMLGERVRRKMVEETDVLEFFTETYEAFQSFSGRGSLDRSIDLSGEDGERVSEAARDVYKEYMSGRERPPVLPDDFTKLIKRMYRVNVTLQDPVKAKSKVAADSLARRMSFTDFRGDELAEFLRLVLEQAVQDAETKLKERRKKDKANREARAKRKTSPKRKSKA